MNEFALQYVALGLMIAIQAQHFLPIIQHAQPNSNTPDVYYKSGHVDLFPSIGVMQYGKT